MRSDYCIYFVIIRDEAMEILKVGQTSQNLDSYLKDKYHVGFKLLAKIPIFGNGQEVDLERDLLKEFRRWGKPVHGIEYFEYSGRVKEIVELLLLDNHFKGMSFSEFSHIWYRDYSLEMFKDKEGITDWRKAGKHKKIVLSYPETALIIAYCIDNPFIVMTGFSKSDVNNYRKSLNVKRFGSLEFLRTGRTTGTNHILNEMAALGYFIRWKAGPICDYRLHPFVLDCGLINCLEFERVGFKLYPYQSLSFYKNLLRKGENK